MKNKLIRISIVFSFIFLLLSFSFKEISLAEEAPFSTPTVVAPGQLSEKERERLEREYRYQVRGKEMLLAPTFAPSAAGPAISEAEAREQTEQEKLYRYFGAASQLYEAGRIEEAIEILKYIVEKNPKDEYVKSWLNRLQEELKASKIKWQKTSQKDATLLKRKKINDLTEEGVAYYKQKRFDLALLRFADILAMDPNNRTAKSYMDKLKEYYLKEVRAESILQKIAPIAGEKSAPREKYIEGILQELETKFPSVEQRMESIVREKRATNLLYQAELESKIKEIIVQKQEEEKRLQVLTFGPGDVVMISVRDHPELSGKTAVRLTGDIVLPLVNTVIPARGLTLEELTAQIQEAMKRYVKDPAITVTVEEYKSKVFYVIDENSSTSYPITRANLTLREALFIADWGPDRAVGRVLLIKPDKIAPLVKKIDAYDLIYRGKLFNDVRIENGDVIYVPHTIPAAWNSYLQGVLAPIQSVASGESQGGFMGATITTHDYVNTIKKYKVP